MKQTLVLRFSRYIAAALVLMVAAQMSEAAVLPVQEPQQPTAAQQTQTASAQTDGDPQTAKPGPDMPQAPAPASQQNSQAEPGFATRSQEAPPQEPQKPQGTAAGPYARPTGVAGSRPAGAAIAPAKQKRKKAILIRVGLIVGGAAAIGAVYGLTKGSPSHP